MLCPVQSRCTFAYFRGSLAMLHGARQDTDPQRVEAGLTPHQLNVKQDALKRMGLGHLSDEDFAVCLGCARPCHSRPTYKQRSCSFVFVDRPGFWQFKAFYGSEIDQPRLVETTPSAGDLFD